MANFYNPKYDTSELIKFTENRVERASFQQIQEAITNKMKEIYGNDIDLTSTTADGQWIMARSLILDKMFEVIVNLSQNINPSTARGSLLDVLCSFNNVFRKGQTYSTVQCAVKPIRDDVKNGYEKTEGDQTYQEIKCVDPNGNTWRWFEYKNIDGTYNTNFTKSEYTYITFTCETIGGVSAKKGTFNKSDASDDATGGDMAKVIDINRYPFKVWQSEDANLGDEIESDESLRTRRELEIANNAVTVLEGVESSLRQIAGIRDVKIINNNTNEDISTNGINGASAINGGDNITIKAHCIYIVIRYEENVNVDALKKTISQTIFNKLTPGILTTGGYDAIPCEVEKATEDGIACVATLTEDTSVESGKTYYEKSSEAGGEPGELVDIEGYTYTAVENPSGNPQESGWYEVVKGMNKNTARNGAFYYEKSSGHTYTPGAYVDKNGYKYTLVDGLTPGVSVITSYYKIITIGEDSTKLSPSSGEIIFDKIDYKLSSSINYYISWKKCIGNKYPIHLEMLVNQDFDKNTYLDKIKEALINYTSNITLNKKMTISEIINAINTSCIPKNGLNPYIVLNGYINVDNAQKQYVENHLSYFNYNKNNCTITIGDYAEPDNNNYVQTTLDITV